jgi:LysR family transcriptional regulator, low CO2-responsive transcriptional regulator
MPLDSDRLLAFVTVAHEQGFSKAAQVLGKTQSAVSQAVMALEAELGARLFVRDGRSTRLTDAGRVLLEHAERVLDDMARARERLSALGELRSGRLVIGATDTLACYVLPPVLRAFRDRHPGVELRLEHRPSPATAVEVAEWRVDVGIVALPLPAGLEARGRPIEGRVQIEELAPYEDVAICPPDHPLAKKRRVQAAELAREPLLLLDRTTGTRAFLEGAWARDGLRPTVQMEMTSVEVLKRLVELGFGVSIVPSVSVQREVEAGTLVAVKLVEPRSGRSVGLVTPVGSASSPAVAAFSAVARSILR